MEEFIKRDSRGYEIKLNNEEIRIGKCNSNYKCLERLCVACGKQLPTIGEKYRKNGKKNLDDWTTRPFHKNCYGIIMSNYRIDHDLSQRGKFPNYFDIPTEKELIIYFENHPVLSTKYIRELKNISTEKTNFKVFKEF